AQVYCSDGWTAVLKLSANSFCYGSAQWTSATPFNEGQHLMFVAFSCLWATGLWSIDLTLQYSHLDSLTFFPVNYVMTCPLQPKCRQRRICRVKMQSRKHSIS